MLTDRTKDSKRAEGCALRYAFPSRIFYFITEMISLRSHYTTMFHRISTFVSLLFLGTALLATSTQAQRIGYTNQQALLANMPEMQNVQQQIQKEQKQMQQELQQQRQKLQKDMQQYQQQQSLLDDSAQQKREQELRQRQQQLQKQFQQRQQQLQKRERELMQPLLEDLQSAIDQVAANQNLEVVMRTQALLYVDQNSDRVVDITRDVAQELGINLDQAPQEPSPTVDPNAGPPEGGGQ